MIHHQTHLNNAPPTPLRFKVPVGTVSATSTCTEVAVMDGLLLQSRSMSHRAEPWPSIITLPFLMASGMASTNANQQDSLQLDMNSLFNCSIGNFSQYYFFLLEIRAPFSSGIYFYFKCLLRDLNLRIYVERRILSPLAVPGLWFTFSSTLFSTYWSFVFFLFFWLCKKRAWCDY